MTKMFVCHQSLLQTLVSTAKISHTPPYRSGILKADHIGKSLIGLAPHKIPTDAGFAAGYPGTPQNVRASDQ
jgi:hypothetical protein